MMFMDGLRNIIANLGTARDKASASSYFEETIDVAQLVAMYRSSAIARKIIDLPAQDSMREWREWSAPADQISLIEAEEKRLLVQPKMLKNAKRGRLFGGSAMFIGTGEKDLMKPLIPDRIQKGGLKYLSVINRGDLLAGDIELDPREEFYGKPKYFTLYAGMSAQVLIHPSRLVISGGNERPDDFYMSGQSENFNWSDPVLQSMLTDVRNLDATIANIASLIFEAKVDVIGIKGFNSGLQSGGRKYEQLVLDRASLTNTGKGINGAMVMDADDTYSQKSASFATLPDLMDRYMQITSAGASIPMMSLFEVSPTGLNASGDGPTRSYYDRIKSHQTLGLSPSMAVLDECLIRSALGSRPEEIFYTWRPLWQATQKEKAETGKTIVDTFKTINDMDLLPPEAIGKAIVNGLTESGLAPGLEADVSDWFDGLEFKKQQKEAIESEEAALLALEEQGNAEAEEKRTKNSDRKENSITDATPRTLYIRRDVLNGKQIIEWAQSQGFKTTLKASDLHVTVAFSRDPVDWMAVGESHSERIEVSPGGARIMEQFGGARVLLFNSDDLKWRHRDIHEKGAKWSHPEYQPHITISYDDDSPDLDNVMAYQGRIILGPEIFQEVNDDWQKGIVEE